MSSLLSYASVRFSLLLLVAQLLISGCFHDSNNGAPPPGDTTGDVEVQRSVVNYKTSLGQLVEANALCLEAAQAWENADYSALSWEEIAALADAFVLRGEAVVAAMEDLNGAALEIQELSSGAEQPALLSAGKTVARLKGGPGAIDLLPDAGNGVGVGTVKDVNDLIQETKDKVEELNAKQESGQITEDEYKVEMDKLRQQQLRKTAGKTLAAVSGGGAGLLAGCAASKAGAGVVVVLGSGVLTGVAVGVTVYFIWEWYSQPSPTQRDGEQCTGIATGAVQGNTFPIYGELGTLIIDIPGYTPVVIRNFSPPADGVTIDFQPVKIEDARPGDQIVINYDQIRTSVISATVDIPGHFSGTFVPSSTLAGLGAIDEDEGYPTIFGPADRSAIESGTAPFLMLMLNKDLGGFGDYVFGLDIVDGGNADVSFWTPSIRDEDTDLPVGFYSQSGTLHLDEYSTVPGEWIGGSFQVNIYAQKIICHDATCDDYSLEEIPGTIDGTFKGYLTNALGEPSLGQ
jgi:hypothetical protein